MKSDGSDGQAPVTTITAHSDKVSEMLSSVDAYLSACQRLRTRMDEELEKTGPAPPCLGSS